MTFIRLPRLIGSQHVSPVVSEGGRERVGERGSEGGREGGREQGREGVSERESE